MNLDEYPKTIKLRDGSVLTLRPMVREDEEGLMEFFRGIPEGERLYLRNDVINPEVIHHWVTNIDYDRVLPILAVSGRGNIVGNATLHRDGFSWAKHVGNIRLTVLPEYRRKGLARIMVGELFAHALTTDLEKIVAEIVLLQEDVRLAFNQLGFRTEAVLRDHHVDPRGVKHDVIIISNDINQLWKMWQDQCEAVSGIQQKEY
jgi:GNAT superfamily N-acetyltransferase